MTPTIFHGVASIDPVFRGAVLAVGNFDGVHLGHQRILRTARALAHVSSAAVIAMTFEPHPVELLRPEQAPRRLSPWHEKARQLAAAGADAVVRLETDWPLLSLEAEEFVREILIKQIHPSYIVEGPDFGFGRGRKGNVETLRQLSPRGGFQVHVVEPFQIHIDGDDTPCLVSSTLIRKLLCAGDIPRATACLGRPYTLIGTIIRGAGEGKSLGFPTINIDFGEQLVPREGVYAGTAEIDGHGKPAAISIGYRPTLGGGGTLAVEAFILDDARDTYGRTARLDLTAFIREQRRFESREALSAQIARDVAEVRRLAEPRS
ncbi:MAG: bifunctional riboflavin kinase/FAD synthetase [Phycisphaerae bacterium]|nr:bifunctional riboflavin kinase/FAD synthetase [Phycisphaerae bacterium]